MLSHGLQQSRKVENIVAYNPFVFRQKTAFRRAGLHRQIYDKIVENVISRTVICDGAGQTVRQRRLVLSAYGRQSGFFGRSAEAVRHAFCFTAMRKGR